MKVSIDYELTTCKAVLSEESELPEMSFAIESIISHFLGRGVARFECIRTKNDNNSCTLQFNSLCAKSGSMQFSKVASIGHAVAQRIFPRNINANERFQEKELHNTLLEEGQHRHSDLSKLFSNSIFTIIETKDLNPSIPLSVLSYGLSDMFTGLFALDVSYLKWQGSLRLMQLYVRHNMLEEKLHDYIQSKKDYDVKRKIGTLN